MNIFKMSAEDFEKEMENFKGYLDTLSDGEFIAQLILCGANPKFSVRTVIKQLFCKHEFRRHKHSLMIGLEEEYVICRKCGEFHKINGDIPTYISLSEGGNYGNTENSSKTK